MSEFSIGLLRVWHPVYSKAFGENWLVARFILHIKTISCGANDFHYFRKMLLNECVKLSKNRMCLLIVCCYTSFFLVLHFYHPFYSAKGMHRKGNLSECCRNDMGLSLYICSTDHRRRACYVCSITYIYAISRNKICVSIHWIFAYAIGDLIKFAERI